MPDADPTGTAMVERRTSYSRPLERPAEIAKGSEIQTSWCQLLLMMMMVLCYSLGDSPKIDVDFLPICDMAIDAVSQNLALSENHMERF